MVQQLNMTDCPDCGTRLTREPWAAGLCPRCLMHLAVEDSFFGVDVVGDPDAAPTLQFEPRARTEDGSLTDGQILGRRYRVGTLLGRGGMGEVWWALDLKLRVDVALKALRQNLLQDKRALEALRQEVRTAREVISPNVCRVFDLVELESQELVSMEFIDGITLADVLKMRAPLDLTEAREIAAQFLAGLEAIHEAGLVHRDVKPENIMVTRSGRVVVMDFGIAKGLADRATGTVSGTPAYMAPEQSRGESVSPRADVFSAGVVLAEMIAPDGLARHADRAAIWEGIHHDPPRVPDSAWAPLLTQAVARRAEERFADTAALARALEEVALRVEDSGQLTPYPGLAAFTQEDAEYFFGRELEVEEMWKKLRRPHLLGLIGPSGAGKSSFLRAGLLPVIPTGWRAVITAPGSQPFLSVARTLAPELAGDERAVQELLEFDNPEVAVSTVSRWRQAHDEVLIILDQFEELFTQNPPEVQTRFAELLGKLALETDVHVLVSMRDDFLFYCSGQPALTPMFSELTPLRPPSGTALRRALVQPALKCGYRFEDEALVDEMVGEVGDERGALPMLAFAAARLWDLRDRDQGVLTREAYEHIGGVGGALAQHAEATLERIGQAQIPVVRELFRNLMTAQGTRAARDRDELLSVFSGVGAGLRAGPREGAEAVVNTLIDARLLTSYEIPAAEEDDEPQNRVEIIHESLLTNWPRLVRWQTQDADSVQLRDQVRQAAQMWKERGKPEDLLWTGTSFGEYQLWRERYEGGLSQQEEAFAAAMVSKAHRARRRRRAILAGVVAILAVGLSIVAGLWFQAEQARKQAEAETLRAEASKLLALGRLELDGFPTGALAYATRSLELADTPEGRRFASEILWRGPVARILSLENYKGAFSPDGEWLAVETFREGIRIVSADGKVMDPVGRTDGISALNALSFSSRSDILVRSLAALESGIARMRGVERWRLPELEALPYLDLHESSELLGLVDLGLFLARPVDHAARLYDVSLIPTPPFPYEEVEPKALGRIQASPEGFMMSSSGDQILFRRDNELMIAPLRFDSASAARSLGATENEIRHYGLSPDASRVVAAQVGSDMMQVWSTVEGDLPGGFVLTGNKSSDPLSWPQFSPDSSRLVMASSSEAAAYLWNLEAPLDGAPVVLQKKNGGEGYSGGFHPGGHWLATFHGPDIAFWPVNLPYVRSIGPQGDSRFSWIGDIEFSRDSNWIASCSNVSGLHAWPLKTGLGSEWTGRPGCLALAFDQSGRHLLTARNDVHLGSVGPTETADHLGNGGGWSQALAFDPTGRFAASAHAPVMGHQDEARLLVWELDSGATYTLDLFADCQSSQEWDGEACLVRSLGWAADGSLYTGGSGGVRKWQVETGESRWIVGPGSMQARVEVSADGRYLLTGAFRWTVGTSADADSGEVEKLTPRLRWTDLETGEEKPLGGVPVGVTTAMGLDPTGQVFAVGTEEGSVWVGRVSGGEMHMLVGHDAPVQFLAFSPDGEWLASATAGEILLWPMPDLDSRPLLKLSHQDLLARLRGMTNVLAVEDPGTSTGWTLETGPFTGWRVVPEW